MDTMFINSEESKTYDLHRVILTVSNKVNLQGSNR